MAPGRARGSERLQVAIRCAVLADKPSLGSRARAALRRLTSTRAWAAVARVVRGLMAPSQELECAVLSGDGSDAGLGGQAGARMEAHPLAAEA